MSARANGQAATVAFVGDLMLGRNVSQALVSGLTAAELWGDTLEILTSVDAVIGNLECPISETQERWVDGIKAFRFRAEPCAVDALASANIRCVALANNHALDCGASGLRDTRSILSAAGIAYAGAGANTIEAMTPAIFDAGGLVIGVYAVTNTLFEFAATPDRAGTFHVPIRTNKAMTALLSALAGDLRRRRVDHAILSIHWGPNWRWWPPLRYRAFARLAIETGFDVIHGHSAHVVQAVEYYGPGLILYDTGDFIDDYWVFPGFRSDRSFIFIVDIRRGTTPRLKLVPVSLSTCRVRLTKGRETIAIGEAMVRRCRGFTVDLFSEGNGLTALPVEGTMLNGQIAQTAVGLL